MGATGNGPHIVHYSPPGGEITWGGAKRSYLRSPGSCAHSHSESALNLQTMRTRSILVGFIAAMLVSEMAAVECLEKEKCPGGQERCDANTSELDGESVCEVLCKTLLTQTSAAGHSKPDRKI